MNWLFVTPTKLERKKCSYIPNRNGNGDTQ
jgi:hypothetical protein